ncbi:ATP/GTP-binding protein [Micromonospora sp. NPDC050417]|uniref:ATP/GTP-binding protein n=1 Tax=Micromonospora sp. NPDC050417 TaxID=3364280 RepID=UPI0037909ECD
MLLRFRLANHRSVRDEVELSLVASTMKGAAPARGDWTSVTVRTSGIYGANASGKSTVIDGLRFMVSAVRRSATAWSERGFFPHYPFVLDASSTNRPSLYELDLTVDGTRYTYGFSSTSVIAEEWLYSYPSGRRRMLFERVVGGKTSFGRHLAGDNIRISKALTDSTLYLSLAATNKHPVLLRLYDEISHNIHFAEVDESDQQTRLRGVIGMLSDERSIREATALLRFADVGITNLQVEDTAVSDEMRERLSKFVDAVREFSDAPADMFSVDQLFEVVRKSLKFVHVREQDSLPALDISQESSGTVAWLALAVPAVESIRSGDIFVVDEVDSSLHPKLSAALINLFRDRDLNRTGAQLIFTSHDTSLLGSVHGDLLGADEIWFTEKDAAGVSRLYSLAEFSTRSKDNFERRYLQGRYGAIPLIAIEELKQALLAD